MAASLHSTLRREESWGGKKKEEEGRTDSDMHSNLGWKPRTTVYEQVGTSKCVGSSRRIQVPHKESSCRRKCC